ncbi:MAG: DNA polymerase III subunit delta [Acidimicrobiales bacterium]
MASGTKRSAIASPVPPSAPVVLVRGDDDVLVRDTVRRLVEERVGDQDRSLMLAEFAGEDYPLAELVDSAQTPPFLTARRVVVGWGLHRFKTADLGPLRAYLADPLDSTDLVLVFQEGRIPKALTDAVAAAGGQVVTTGPQTGRGGKRDWIDEQLARSSVRLDARAKTLIETHLGEDLARLLSLLHTLETAYGGDALLGVAELEPFLGEAGSVPPWELTDVIDKGDIAEAVRRVRRLLGGGQRHPLQVMVTLTSHVERMLALHGSGARSEKEAAVLLGLKGSTFPARKALDQGRKLGPAKLSRAVDLLADADLALRGNSAWEPALVMEVLVARLAALAR